MDKIFLPNFDYYDHILEYDVAHSIYMEIKKEKLPENALLHKGYYVALGNDVIGVFVSSKGPILFHNMDRFKLFSGKYTVSVVEGQTQNVFSLYETDKSVFSISYSPTPFRGYDVWSAENEDVDMFFWIQARFNDPTLHQYYVDSP